MIYFRLIFFLIAIFTGLANSEITTYGPVIENTLSDDLYRNVRKEVQTIIEGWYTGKISRHHGTIPIKQIHQPRTFIEKAIETLWDGYVKKSLDGDPDSEYLMAEWWIRASHNQNGMGFHFDRDDEWFAETRQVIFPKVMSVFYLSDVGSPTVIMDWKSDKFEAKECNKEQKGHKMCRKMNMIPQKPESAAIVMPKHNKYVFGNGSLFHGVLPYKQVNTDKKLNFYSNSPLVETINDFEFVGRVDFGKLRVALLINYWREHGSSEHLTSGNPENKRDWRHFPGIKHENRWKFFKKFDDWKEESGDQIELINGTRHQISEFAMDVQDLERADRQLIPFDSLDIMRDRKVSFTKSVGDIDLPKVESLGPGGTYLFTGISRISGQHNEL